MPLFFTSAFESLPTFWKLSVVRCTVYMAIIGWGSFLTGVEGYEKFSDMTQLQHVKLFGGVLIAMAGVLLAFLDNTINKVKPPEGDSVTVTRTDSVVTHSEPVEPPPQQ